MPYSDKNTFQSQKALQQTQRMIKKLLSLRKKSFTPQFYSLSLLGQNSVSTNSTSGKKSLRKPILLFES